MNGLFFQSLFFCILFPVFSFAQSRPLSFYLQQAKQNSPLLYGYQKQIQSLGLDSKKMKAGYGPQLVANSNLSYAPIMGGWGYDQVITNGQNVSALMVVSKEIIGKNNLNARLNSFSINQESIANQSKISEKELVQNITQQYIITYSSQQQSALANEIYAFLGKEDATLKRLTRTAVFKQTDYLTFKVALQQQGLVKNQLETQFLNDLGTLNYLSGITDSSRTNLEKPEINTLSILPFSESVYAKNYRLDSFKNANDAKIIHYDYQPKINVFADGGYQSSLAFEPYKNFGMSVGLNFSLPVYDGNQKKMALMQNKLAEDKRKKYQDFSERQYGQQTLQLQQQIQQYDQLIAQAKTQMDYAKALVEANKQQLQTGDVRMTDYLLSIHNYLNLRSNIIQNTGTRMALFNQLNNLILK